MTDRNRGPTGASSHGLQPDVVPYTQAMPETGPRHRLVAALAASLVGLFVVVVGSTPSGASPRVSAVAAASTAPAQVGPVDAAATPEHEVTGVDLGGLEPGVAAAARADGSGRADSSATDVAVPEATAAHGRGPPAP